MVTKRGLTLTEAAARLQTSTAALEKAMKTGRISAACWEIIEGRRLIIDPERAGQEFIEHRKSKPGPGRPAKQPQQRSQGTETLYELQTRHEKVKVAERKLKLRRAQGGMVDRKSEDRRLTELLRGLADRFLNYPADAAGRLAAKFGIDAAALEIDLEADIRGLLAGMTAESLTAGSTARERAA